ncbi:MAG: hypothetical protein K0R75_1729 [Paenibacillaceae bacterium]|nr:hypothetical protein [Paenibacillaceae bacterium]
MMNRFLRIKRITQILDGFLLPSAEFLTEPLRPKCFVQAELRQERERPALDAEADTAGDGGSFAHFNVESIPERVAVKIDRAASNRLAEVRDAEPELVLHLLVALERTIPPPVP